MKIFLAIASLLLLVVAGSAVAKMQSPFCKSAIIFEPEDFEEPNPFQKRTKLVFVVKGEGYKEGWTMALTFNKVINNAYLWVAALGNSKYGTWWTDIEEDTDCQRDTACPDGVVGSCTVCNIQLSCPDGAGRSCRQQYLTLPRLRPVTLTIDVHYWGATYEDPQIVSAV